MNKKEVTQPKIKKYYTIKVETLLPATLSYRILAEDPEEALKLLKNQPPNDVKYKLIGRKELKLTIYDFGTNIIRLVKNLIK